MAGKQAKILSADHIDDLLFFADRSRHALRNRVMVLLSVKAGLRAGEIANLTWQMVLNPAGEVSTIIELRDYAASSNLSHGLGQKLTCRQAKTISVFSSTADMCAAIGR